MNPIEQPSMWDEAAEEYGPNAAPSEEEEKDTIGEGEGQGGKPTGTGSCGVSHPSPGFLVRILVNHNPFYVISAVLVLAGLRRMFDGGLSAGNSHVLLSVLGGYAVLTALTSVAVIRWGGVWEDARSLLLILLVFLGAGAVALDDMVLNRPETGGHLVLLGALTSIALLELVLKGSRIRLSAAYRVPFYALSALLYMYPLALLQWLPGETLRALYNGLAVFPSVCSLLLMGFLPAAWAGQHEVEGNGTPWPFPVFPWLAIVGLAVVSAGRSYYLTLSFFPIHGDASPFGVFWLIPLVYAVSTLLLGLGREGRQRILLRVAMLLPLATIPMAYFGVGGAAGRKHVLELASWLATPFELNAIALLLFAAFTLWLRAPGARYLMATALGMSLFARLGDIQAAVPTSNGLAIIGTAALPVYLVWEYLQRRGSWRLALAGAVPIVTLWVRLEGTAFTAHHAAIPVHLLLTVAWFVALVERDRFSALLRGVVSLVTFVMAAVVVLFARDVVPFHAPVLLGLLYAAGAFVLTFAGGWLTRCPHMFTSSGAQALVLGGRFAVLGSAWLHGSNCPKGTGIVAVGMLVFGVGALISTGKGGVRRNSAQIKRLVDTLRATAPTWSKVSDIFVRAILVGLVLMLLFAFLTPVFHCHGGREKATRINCSGNLKQIGLAMRMYSGDNDEVFPPDLYRLVEEDYLTTVRVYQCPTAHGKRSRWERDKRTEKVTRATFKSDYVYFTGLTENVGKATATPLACDRVDTHTKFGNVLFVDGHVKGFAGSEWWKAAGISEPPGGL